MGCGRYCRVLYEGRRVEKCISLCMASKLRTAGIFCRVVQVVRVDTSIVESYESNGWTQLKALSRRKRILSSGKCISLGRLRRFKHVVVSEAINQQVISCRVLQVVRVDISVVESTKNVVEWKNASH